MSRSLSFIVFLVVVLHDAFQEGGGEETMKSEELASSWTFNTPTYLSNDFRATKEKVYSISREDSAIESQEKGLKMGVEKIPNLALKFIYEGS